MARQAHPIVAQLKADRIRTGLTLRDVHEQSGLAIQTVGAWELGHRFPTLLAADTYAHLLGRVIILGTIQEPASG